MSKERYAEHTVPWGLPNGDSVTKGNYNLSDIGTKYIPIQTEIVSDNKDQTINELQQRIAELEEQLKECVRPKFKIGQEVYWIDTRVNSFNEPRYRIESYLIDSIVITSTQFRYYGDDGLWLGDDELFATEQEAQAKLKELQEK